jgi:DNA primase
MLNDVLVPFADLSEDNEAYQYAIGRNIPKNRHKDLYYVDNVQKLKTLVDGYEEKIVTEEARLVLPFIDASGVLVGLTGRALRGETQRYMNMRVVPGASMVFGMNRVNVSETVYVTEGAIDSLCIHNCVAAGGSNLRTAADVIDKENLVLVFDNEPRAKEILSIMKKAIDDNFAVCVWPESYEEKDINKMLCDGKSQEEIENTIKERTFKGAAALLEYNRWSKF